MPMKSFLTFFENRQVGMSAKSAVNPRNDVFVVGGFIVGQNKTKTFLEAEDVSLFGDLSDEKASDFDLQQNDTAQFSKTPVLFDEHDVKFLMQFPPSFRIDALTWRYGEGLFEAHKEIKKNGKPKDKKSIVVNKVAFNVNTHIAPLIQKLTAKFENVSNDPNDKYQGGCYQYDLENWAISMTGDAGEVSYSTSNYKSPARATLLASYVEWTKALARGLLGKTNPNMAVQDETDDGAGRRGRRPKPKAVTVADLKKAGLLSNSEEGEDEEGVEGGEEWADLTDSKAVVGYQAPVSLTWDGRIVDNSKGYFVPTHTIETIKEWIDHKFIDHRGQITWAFENPAEAQKQLGNEFSMPVEKVMQLLPGRMYVAAQVKPYIANDLALKMKWQELVENHPELEKEISTRRVISTEDLGKIVGNENPIFKKLKEHANIMHGVLSHNGGAKPLTPEEFVQNRLRPPHKKIKTTKFGGSEPQFETKAKFPVPEWKLKELGVSKNDYEKIIKKFIIGDDFVSEVSKLNGNSEVSPIATGIKLGLQSAGTTKLDSRGTKHIEALKDWEPQMFHDSQKLVMQNNGLAVFTDFVELLLNTAREAGVYDISHLFNQLKNLNLQQKENLVIARDMATKWARNRASKYVASEVHQLDLGYGTRKLGDRESKVKTANDPRGRSGVEEGGFNWASDIASLDSLKPTIANIKKLKAESEIEVDSTTAAKIISLQSQLLSKATKFFVQQLVQQSDDTTSLNMNDLLKEAKKKAIEWLKSEDVGQNYIEKEMPDISPEEADLILKSIRHRKINKALREPLKDKEKELFNGPPVAGTVPNSGLTSFDQFRNKKVEEPTTSSSIGVDNIMQDVPRNRMGHIKNPAFINTISQNPIEAEKLVRVLRSDPVLAKSVEMYANANNVGVLHNIIAKSKELQTGT